MPYLIHHGVNTYNLSCRDILESEDVSKLISTLRRRPMIVCLEQCY